MSYYSDSGKLPKYLVNIYVFVGLVVAGISLFFNLKESDVVNKPWSLTWEAIQIQFDDAINDKFVNPYIDEVDQIKGEYLGGDVTAIQYVNRTGQVVGALSEALALQRQKIIKVQGMLDTFSADVNFLENKSDIFLEETSFLRDMLSYVESLGDLLENKRDLSQFMITTDSGNLPVDDLPTALRNEYNRLIQLNERLSRELKTASDIYSSAYGDLVYMLPEKKDKVSDVIVPDSIL